MSAQIKPLDESVVNKIAAGEIIISPVNALKEMLENSIDAGASSLDILVKDGGIRLLQITDNGCGISKDDFPILCQRFTTSKLSRYEDLERIATYGFRGEALASISHIAKLTVTSKTREDRCAWRVSYTNGQMISDPKPVAGKDGTVLLAENLFYNMPSRLRALRSASEEYGKILEVVGRYALHSEGIAFSCKKFGDSQFALTVRSNLNIEERIRCVFGSIVSSRLLHFEIGPLKEFGVQQVLGKVSNLDLNSKKLISPIFFINNRLITCNPLARALRQTYSNYLPKGDKPFVYLSILIDPEIVDVNIHPTKREVRFLHEEEIIAAICSKLNEELAKIDSSRIFKTSSIATSQPVKEASIKHTKSSASKEPHRLLQDGQYGQSTLNNGFKRHENKLVRTDASQSKITSFISNQSTPPIALPLTRNNGDSEIGPSSPDNEDTRKADSTTTTNRGPSIWGYTVISKERIDVNLTSIKRLREAVDNSAHKEMTDIFANMTYVGVVDAERRLATIQHDLKLFLLDYGAICYELFYQICLSDFANFGVINLQSVHESDLFLVNILSHFENLNKKSTKTIISKIWGMRDMLKEYFSIDISNNVDSEDKDVQLENAKITSIPLLLKGYTPPLSKLPFLIYRLGTRVNWDEEQPCLDGIMKQVALLYVPEIIQCSNPGGHVVSDDEKADFISKTEQLSIILDNVVFPCIKKRFLAPRNLVDDIVEIANLPGLYRVFERC